MKSTFTVGETLATPTYRLSEAKASKPIDHSSIDRALELTQDLISDPNYKKWFARQAIRLGADRYLGIASEARLGKKPPGLFVFLLKRSS